jgi:hypothetical protein
MGRLVSRVPEVTLPPTVDLAAAALAAARLLVPAVARVLISSN